MPAVKVEHDVGNATKPPPRQPLPPGTYDALVANSTIGLTKQTGLTKLTIEYRIVKTAEGDAAFGGRRVYQDYVLQRGLDDEMNAREAFRIRQLLDATGITYTSGGGSFEFNSDQMHNKAVRITVTQRPGKQPNAEGVIPVFNNVDRVDMAGVLDDADVV